MLDLILACTHHLLILSLAGCLVAELTLVRPGLSAADLPRLGRIDGAYGGLAMAIILVGIARVMFGLKGWEYYVYYPVFWAKMAAFVAVGLLSVAPTLRINAWRRAAVNGMDAVPAAEIASLRSYLKGQAAFLALVAILAAMMARATFY